LTLLLVFPASFADHEGVGVPVNVAIKVGDRGAGFDVLDDDVGEFPYTVYVIRRDEYVSNSGAHELRVLNVKPELQIGPYDFYIFEMLAEVSLLDRDIGQYGYSRPTTVDEAYKVALEVYAYYARKPTLPTGAFLWKTGKGYRLATLARRINIEDFLDAAEDYTLRYMFKAF